MTTALKLGIAGLGTVGVGLVQMLLRQGAHIEQKLGRPIEIVAVSARTRDKDRGLDLGAYQWFDDPVELARSPDIDVFVELIGGEDGAAKDAVEAALDAKHHVVTANKALLAYHAVELAKRAEQNGVALNYEAAIAGGIPIVKTLRESLVGNKLSKVSGILNGTCNYILSEMSSSPRSFGDVLKEAQDKGYAEADPSFDIGGHDAAHKLALLTTLAFGTQVAFDSIYIEGIENITAEDIAAAEELGYCIKLLGVAFESDTGIEQRVHPTMIDKHHPLAQIDGVTNCVAVEGDAVGNILLVGPGAGAGATASSVMSDIVDIARGSTVLPLTQPAANLVPYQRARMRAHKGGYYIRFSVYDRPGALAAIATRVAEQNISVESIVQKGPHIAAPASSHGQSDQAHGQSDQETATTVVMITHDTTEEAMRQALEDIEKDGHVSAKAQMIRIEKL